MAKISSPTGTFDIIPFDDKEVWKSAYLWQYIEKIIHGTARDFGYQEIRTPIFERAELFLRGVGEDLKSNIEQDEEDHLAEEKIDQELYQIRHATSATSLESSIHKVLSLIKELTISDELKSDALDALRRDTFTRLDQLLQQNLREEDRYTIEQILNEPSITAEGEKEYYLNQLKNQ